MLNKIERKIFKIVTTRWHLLMQKCNKFDFIVFLRSSVVPHTSRVNCDEMAGDRLTCEQELLQSFMHLVSISSNFLFLIHVDLFNC